MDDHRQEDGRRGAPFSVRISDGERGALALKEKQSRDARGYSMNRRWRSLGAFVVWAALQWKPNQLELIPEAPTPVEPKKRPKRVPKAKKAKHARRRAKVVPKRRRAGTTKGRGRKKGKK